MMNDDAKSNDDRWLPALDAMIAAPDHHDLLFENDRVRVITTHVMPGDRTPVHTHRWAGVLYVLSWSQFVRYDDQGNVLVDSRTVDALTSSPNVTWAVALPPHSFENVGETEFRVITVELKD